MMCIIPWITDHNLAIFICNKLKLKKKKIRSVSLDNINLCCTQYN